MYSRVGKIQCVCDSLLKVLRLTSQNSKMAPLFQFQSFALILICLGLVIPISSLPGSLSVAEKGQKLNRIISRLTRGAGDVSLTKESTLNCDQGKLIGGTQMNGKIYLGCMYFQTEEYYWIGVIKTFDAATLQPSGPSVELELPQDNVMDKLVASPTQNLLYMVTYVPGDTTKSIWIVTFPSDTGLNVEFFQSRPATLSGLKVTPSGNLILNELTVISVLNSVGKQLSATPNSIHEQGMIPGDVLQLNNGNFLVLHDKKDNFNEYELSELSPDGKVIKSYSSRASSGSPKITTANSMTLLDSGSILLLNRNFDASIPDSILQVQSDLSSGKVLISGSPNGIDKSGTCITYDSTTGKLLVAFPNNRNQPLVRVFKVSA